MGVASFVVEEGLGRPDIEDEIEHLEALGPRVAGSVRASVVTFLDVGPRRDQDRLKIKPASIIGQFCIISFPVAEGETRSYIYEAYHRIPARDKKPLLNNHISMWGRLAVTVGGKEHRLPAAYFCQQNGVTSICAHSATRMIVRTKTDVPVSVRDLNTFWDYQPGGRVTVTKLLAALRHYSMNVVAHAMDEKMPTGRDEHRPERVWRQLALLADSGTSSLLIFSAGTTVDHVVPVVGHTVNTDEWHPIGATLHVNGKEHVSSNSLWIDHLVVHDDMLGPYYCLSRAALLPAEEDEPIEVRLVVTVLDDAVELSPTQADGVGRQAISGLITQLRNRKMGDGDWWEYLCKSLERRLFRTTLIRRQDYTDTLRVGRLDRDQSAMVRRLEDELPELMWMCELSVPNLFLANRARLGEVLIDARASVRDNGVGAIRMFRLPSLLGVVAPGRPSAFQVASWPVKGPVPMHKALQGETW
ncbi:hypothetical protein [Sphingomonas jinjuensis]|nr:hypothetical protein [Sphingomonas jinjuensis]